MKRGQNSRGSYWSFRRFLYTPETLRVPGCAISGLSTVVVRKERKIDGHHSRLPHTPVRQMLVENATVNLNVFRPSHTTEAGA